MEFNICPVCNSTLLQAHSCGFVHHFLFLQNGSVFLSLSQKRYDLEDIEVSSKPCTECCTSTYLITTSDGFSGIAVEFWEV